MAIYRGDGGAGEADNDATISAVTQKALDAAASATEADASATEAATSAASASASATTAASEASNAATSATTASTHATSASTSATNAATSATSASTSASNAATSASAASSSETNAANSASAASTSASNAATSATNAATSESNAASSASAASTSASNAATSASAASTSATNAATSATNAATSETNAATSATNAAASYDSFDDRYLGAKASDPTLDNDGDALLTGALYYNTTEGEMRVYSGSAWVAAYVSLGGALIATNNLSDLANAATARTNLGLGTAAQGTLADSAVQPADNISTLTNDSGYLTGNQTITLSGDATGSGTTAITVTVADDSHNHIIANVDGLQTALDAKLESFTETNDLTAAVTWANVPDANITQSSVTQHQAALSITESQISDLGSYTEIASGTAMLFAQTAAPTGWTKSTTHNNKALRVVSGTAGSGGNAAFTTAFASYTPSGNVSVAGSVGISGNVVVGNRTLTVNQIPSHSHTYVRAAGNLGTTTNANGGGNTVYKKNNANTSNKGNSGSHSHTGNHNLSGNLTINSSSFTGDAQDLAVQYVDVIIATKD